MKNDEIQKLKDTLWANTWSNEEIIEEGICSLKQSSEYKEEGFRRIESVGLLAIYTLQQENQQLKEQIKYLRNEEYLNQLIFERDMLQDLIDNREISKEDKEFIDMTHRNTELLEQLKQRDEVIEETINYLDCFISDTSLNKYDTLKILMYTKKVLKKYKGDNNG